MHGVGGEVVPGGDEAVREGGLVTDEEVSRGSGGCGGAEEIVGDEVVAPAYQTTGTEAERAAVIREIVGDGAVFETVLGAGKEVEGAAAGGGGVSANGAVHQVEPTDLYIGGGATDSGAVGDRAV